jgi:hypothetical protein
VRTSGLQQQRHRRRRQLRRPFGIAPQQLDPMDDHSHPHVAGPSTVGDNGIGVVGVAWKVRLMSCKMFDGAGNGSLAAAIACLDYIAMLRTVALVSRPTAGATTSTPRPARRHRRTSARILFVAAPELLPVRRQSAVPHGHQQRPQADVAGDYQLPNIISVATRSTTGS